MTVTLVFGSDGLILICTSEKCDFKMRMFNLDGYEAQMCGNGIRCFGKFIYDKGLTNKKEITVETLAGAKKLKLNVENKKVKTVEVDMGEPIFEPSEIPVLTRDNPVKNLKLLAEGREFTFTCISMGNPHAITVVEDLEEIDVEKYGKVLEIDPHFPQKANIEFIKVIDKDTIRNESMGKRNGPNISLWNRSKCCGCSMLFKWTYRK